MRIAHIIWALGVGGAETMLVDIANEQVNTEDVAIVVVNDYYDDSLLHKIDPRCRLKMIMRKNGGKSLAPVVKLNLFLFVFKPDIIHFHLPNLRKLVFYPAPKVFTIHNSWGNAKEYPRFQALYSISDGVKWHTKQQGFDSITVWNGIDTRQILPKTSFDYVCGNVCKIICVGRLHTVHKGQDVLIEALSLLKQRGISSFHLDLIGEGDSRKQIEVMIEQLGLHNQVSLLGQRDRTYIYERLCTYDLYVLPSRSEGFGLSVAEAMCAKLPVLVCDLEGPMGVIDNGRLGMAFKTNDPQDLSRKIHSFMQTGININTIEDAYLFAKEHFDISITAKRYIEEYRKVVRQ